MGKNDKYGPKTDLSSLLQQTSEPLSQHSLDPSPIPATVMTDSDYLQQLNNYLDKQTSILDRMERLEAFVESQEERKRAYDDLYSQYTRTLSEMTETLVMNRDFLLDAIDKLTVMVEKVEVLTEDGIELSPESAAALDGLCESVTKKLDDYLSDKFTNLVNDIASKAQTSTVSLSEAADDIRFFKWAVIISVVWGLMGTFFAVGTFLFK